MSPRSRLTLCLCLSLLGCSAARSSSTVRELPLASRVETPGLLFEVRFSDGDHEEADRIGRCLLNAGPRLARWGDFKSGVVVRVYPSHDALEAALSLRGYSWLRAWAWADQIALQSPRTWSRHLVPDRELDELVTHELTHALMYQLIDPGPGARPAPEPPLWFREGLASVTAGQGHRRWGPAELAEWVARHPGVDLLRPEPETYRTEKEAVYGAAHRAFELLLRTSGETAVREILRRTREGAQFEAAFAASVGRTISTFEAESVRAGFDAAAVAGRGASASGAGGP